ncbi:TetR/AcrR family transcriptional regulator [Deinococcus yunweiensis]|uniref:TetR/AcrR family transcriptional regulator n=1 Tax=Deinococcus yunweiensis TaxID=367282 RepID=UPI00398EF4ED
MPSNPTRRETLTDAGLRVLAAHGARHLTHRATDREAGVPLGTTVNYFSTRTALLAGLGHRIFERLAPAPAEVPPPGTAPAAAYIHNIVRRTTEQPELTLALFELRLEAARHPELARALTSTLERSYAQDVAFHGQAGLPGGAREVALLHYAVDGLLLDLLTVSINGRQDTAEMVELLVRRLLHPA